MPVFKNSECMSLTVISITAESVFVLFVDVTLSLNIDILLQDGMVIPIVLIFKSISVSVSPLSPRFTHPPPESALHASPDSDSLLFCDCNHFLYLRFGVRIERLYCIIFYLKLVCLTISFLFILCALLRYFIWSWIMFLMSVPLVGHIPMS